MEKRFPKSKTLVKDGSSGKGISRGNVSNDGEVHTDKRSYKCDFCEKKYTRSSHLTRHLRIHSDKKLFECDVCRKIFSQEDNLKSHVRIHTGVKPYECNICKKKIAKKSNLKHHMKIHIGENATGEKPHECSICKGIFSSRLYLKHHMRIHTGEKPYECDICSRKFSHEISLKTHMRIHTGEKPYECDICNKRFSDKTNFKRHTKTHTGEKPYYCNICEKKFTEKRSVETHMRIHTGEKPFECDVCKRNFAHKSRLKTHLRIHTGEKPYECDICKWKFSREDALKKHRKVHTDEKLYECNIYEKVFSQVNHLNHHMRICASGKPDDSEDIVIQPSGSLEGNEDTHSVNHNENSFCTKEEISDVFDDDDSSNFRGESLDNRERLMGESLPLVGQADSCSSGDGGSSHLKRSETKRESGDEYSLKSKTENILHCPAQVVETVFDDDDACQIKIEGCHSLDNMSAYWEARQQKQLPSVNKESKYKYLDCLENIKGDGYIEEKRENDFTNEIITDKAIIMSDDHVFDIHRVYVVESKNSGSSDAEDRKDF